MSSENYNLCLKNGKAIIDDQLVSTNIYANDGKIAHISDKSFSSDKSIDCTNLVILPGVIDSQVHFREPGLEGKETLESGMLSAVAGGVTSIFEMPNTNLSQLLQRLLRINYLEQQKAHGQTTHSIWVAQ